jgi:ribulose-5-phosphate 4-epimerase/fuculose-1-phosphate aldolase
MLDELKARVCAANKSLPSCNLAILTRGNVSAFDQGHKIIAIKPSSDINSHLEIYNGLGDEIQSIVHTHSPYATAYAQAALEIPCLGTTHADYFFGPIPVTRKLLEAEIQENYETNIGRVIMECFKTRDIDPAMLPAWWPATAPLSGEPLQKQQLRMQLCLSTWHTLMQSQLDSIRLSEGLAKPFSPGIIKESTETMPTMGSPLRNRKGNIFL